MYTNLCTQNLLELVVVSVVLHFVKSLDGCSCLEPSLCFAQKSRWVIQSEEQRGKTAIQVLLHGKKFLRPLGRQVFA